MKKEEGTIRTKLIILISMLSLILIIFAVNFIVKQEDNIFLENKKQMPYVGAFVESKAGTPENPSGVGASAIQSDIFPIDGISKNGKTVFLDMWIDSNNKMVLLWKTEKKGYKPITEVQIDGVSITNIEGCESYEIYDRDGTTILQNHNDTNYYYFAIYIDDYAAIDTDFQATIVSGAPGHSVDLAVIKFGESSLKVVHNFGDFQEIDWLQSKYDIVTGEIYSLDATSKADFEFLNANIEYGNGTKEVKTVDNFDVQTEAGLNVVTFNYAPAYIVEYYYDGSIDSTKTEKLYAEFGTQIDSYTDNIITGYKLEKTENFPLVLTSDITKNVIKVYYVKDTFEYNVEYYYDGTIDSTKTDKLVGTYQDVIDTYQDKVIEGYILEKTENLPLTITENPANNVIKVYYVRMDTLSYSVKYLEQGTDKELFPQKDVGNKTFGEIITETAEIIDGYDVVESDIQDITIGIGLNEITFYYKKRTDIKYTIEYYYDGVKDDTLTETEVGEFQSQIDTYIDKNKIGYKLEKVEGKPITIVTDESKNIMKVYYVKDTFGYTVEYYYEGVIDSTKTEALTGIYQDVIDKYQDKVINGYVLEKTENLPLTISENSANNVIKIYYIKRSDLSYRVKYLEQGTNTEIATTKVVPDQVFESKAKENAIDIDGYNKVEPTIAQITIGTGINEIIFYYTKRTDIGYTIEYYYDGIKDDTATETGVGIFQSQINTYIDKNKIGYKLEKVEGNPITLVTDESKNIMKVYYVKDIFGYSVEYYYAGTKDDSKTDNFTGTYQDVIDTYQDKVINGYVFEKTENLPLTVTENATNNIIKVYYIKRSDLSYTVKYLEQGTDAVLHAQKDVPNQVFESKVTEDAIDIEGYNKENPTSIEITIGTGINEIKFYYTKRTDLSYTVNYYEEGTTNKLAESKVVNNQTYKTIVTEDAIDITGYTKLDPTQETITIEVTGNEINFYYKKVDGLSYTVNYYEEGTLDKVAPSKDVDGKVYKDQVTETAIDVDGYNKVEPTEQTIEIDVANNVINFYYTKRTDLSYTVKYLEQGTEKELHVQKDVENQTFGDVVTETAEVIDGYNVVGSNTQNATIGTGLNCIIFYYTKRTDIGYTIEYYYDELKDDSATETGVGAFESQIDTYTDKNKTGYKLEKVEGNPITLVTDETQNIMKVYYVKDTFGYTVEYYYDGNIDNTKTDNFTAIYGDIITIYTDKNITGYKLEKTENNPLTITENAANNVMKIYYVKDIFDYTVEYYYEGAKDNSLTDVIKATYQDVIDTYEDKVKDGYVFEKTENIPLTISEDITSNVIKVYYRKRSDLSYTVKYLEQGTNKVLHAQKDVPNQVFESKVTENAIDIDGYNKVAPTSIEITMTTGINEAIFYYTKRTDLGYRVKYLEQGTNKVLHAQKDVPNQVFESKVTENAIDIDGYNKVEPTSVEITITTGINEAIFYYTKRTDLSYRVKYLEQGTNKGLHPQKDVGNQTFEKVVTEAAEMIDGYNLVGSNTQDITIGTGKNEIIFYYTKRTDIKYTIEYYYDGVKEDSATESGVGVFESQINTYIDKNKIGYKLEKVEGKPITLVTDESQNIMKVYYIKDTFRYSVEYYYDGIIDNTKTDNFMGTYGDIVNTYIDKNITGYRLEKTENDPLTITENTANNVMKIYYVKDNFNYTVEYYYATVKDDTQTDVINATYKDVINTYQDKVKDGYVFEKTENLPLTVSENETLNIIKVYYKKRSDLSYKVKYLEQGTDIELATEKVVPGQVFESTVTETAIDIEGYNKVDPTTQNITIGTGVNEIIFYYTKRTDLSYTVNYYEEGTFDKLATSKVVNNQTFKSQVTEDAIDITGYTKLEPTQETIIIEVSGNEINFYYKKAEGLSYTVNYYEEGTLDKIAPSKNVDGKVYKDQVTEKAIDVDGYNKVEPTEQTIEIDVANNVINFYYTKRTDLSYSVKYLEEGTNEVLAGQKDVPNQVFESKVTENAIDIDGYDKVAPISTEITIGTGINEIIFYYTKRTDLSYTVKYLEKDTNLELSGVKNVPGQIFESKVTENAIDIEGYDKVDPTSAEITIGTGVNEVIFYYTKRTDLSYIVNYYEEGTTNKLAESKIENNQVFENTVTEDAIDIVGYTKLDPTQVTIKIKVTGNEINFYYKKVDGLSYTVNYYEKDTTDKIAPSKNVDGKVYKDQVTEKAIDIDGYNKVEPTEVTIEIDVANNVIDFYYTKRTDIRYTIEYYYDGILDDGVTETGVGEFASQIDTYIDKNKIGYKLEKVEGNPITLVTDESQNIMKVYYVKDTFGYTVEYYYDGILDDTKTDNFTGKYGDIINSYTDKNITGYKLEKTENNPLTISENPANNVMKVYYIKDSFNYTVEYYYAGAKDDTLTEKIKATYQDTIDNYTDKVKDGYIFEKTENLPLTVSENETSNIIKVYYAKRSDLSYTVKYLEKDTNIEVATPKVVIDQIFESKITENAIDIEGYDKVDPTTAEITIGTGVNEAIFYYTKRTDLSYTVNYYEEGTLVKLAESKIVSGQTYKSDVTEDAIEITGYTKLDPTQVTITIDVTGNIINFYYKKVEGLSYTVNYYEKDTTNKVASSKNVDGKVYKDQVTEQAIDVDGYNKLEPTEITIEIDVGKNEINFYYTKRTDINYAIEYYYDGIKDDSATETGVGEFKSQIDTYIDKNKIGYKFEKVEGKPITLVTDESQNIMKVYYIKDTFGYTVEYYYDGVINDSKTDNFTAIYGDIITTYTDKNITGYRLDRTENNPLTITENSTSNVMKIYYVKDNFDYTVEYYYAGVKDDTRTDIINATYQDVIDTYTDKLKDGYIFEKTENLPLTISEDISSNVIKIYYQKRSDLSYIVKYLEQGTNTELVTAKTVPDQVFESTVTENAIDIDGYDKVAPTNVQITIGTGVNEIIFYYTKRADIKYSIEYYYDGVKDNSLTETGVGTFESQIDTYIDKNKTGYRLEKVEGKPITLVTDESKNIMKVYYVKDTFGYSVEYYYDGIIDNTKTENFTGTYGDVVNAYNDKNITGYVFEKTENYPLTISEDEVANIIKVYYQKRTDLSYIVNYYEEGTSNKLAESKIVTGQTYKAEITENAIDIIGYTKQDPTQVTITIDVTGNEIDFYYKKVEGLSYTVNYYEEATGNKIAPSKDVDGKVYKDQVTETAIDIDGYNKLEPTEITIEIDVANNVIDFYYTKRTDIGYSIEYYYDGIKDDTVTETGVGEFDSQIDTYIDKNKTGYRLEKVEGKPITLVTDESKNIMKVYYVKDNFDYTVEYYFAGLKDDTLTDTINATYQDKIDTYTDKVKDGYIFEKTENLPLTVSEDVTKNIIRVFYEKRTDLSYTVRYVDKDTGKTIEVDKVVNNQKFEDIITEQAIKIDGYNLDGDETQTLKITTGANIITFNYTKKKDLSYTVKYLEEDTDKELSAEKVEGNQIFGNQVTEKAINIDGYNLVSEMDQSITIGTGINEIVFYYTKRTDLSYTVKYLEKGTEQEIKKEKVVTDQTFESTVTETAEEIYGYDKLDPTTIQIQITTGENIIRFYYSKKVYNITTEVNGVGGTISGEKDNPYENVIHGENSKKEIKISPEYGYKIKSITVNSVNVEFTPNPDKTFILSLFEDVQEHKHVIVEFEKMDSKLTVKYVDKYTNEEISEESVQTGLVGDNYDLANYEKEIENYTLISEPSTKVGTLTEEEIVETYYYAINSRIVVNYIDKYSGTNLETITEEGYEGKTYTSAAKNYEGYVLVEKPENETVTMTREEIILNYYYLHVSDGVIEKHIDLITNETLYNETHEGEEGTPYDIKSREFEGYDLVEDKLPTNSKGVMTKGVIEVKYYYVKKATIEISYIDKITNKNLAENDIIDCHDGDSYETKPKVFEGYDLVEMPSNSSGTVNVTKNPDGTYDTVTEIKYYYAHESKGVIVKYVDKSTGKVIVKEQTISGNEGDKYTTKPIEIEGYDLIEIPENANGNMSIDETVVIYYYIKKSSVRVKYIDEYTNKELLKEIVINGHEGDAYKTESKVFEGYDLKEVPENAKGNIAAEPTEVIYYYRRKATVIVKYIDKDTKEEIEEKEIIEGYYGEEYELSKKDIKFYKLIESPEESKGEFIKDKEEFVYYYDKLSFNMAIEKKISAIILDGKRQTVGNGELEKVEIYRKNVDKSTLYIEYIIRVRNTGEIAGNATIVENIPQGLEFTREQNTGWTRNGDTATYKIENLGIGETKELKVVMKWQNSSINFGTKDNIASLNNVTNDAKYEETNEKDNEDNAKVIITVSTGTTDKITQIVVGMLDMVVMAGAVVILVSKKH